MTDNLASPASTDQLPQRRVLDNGIVVLVKPNPTADIVAARLFMRCGSGWETEENAGLTNLLAALLTRGTETLSSLDIAEQVESVGAGLGTDAATDYLLLSLKTVSADFASLLTLAGEILRSPSFPESELSLERRLILQNIRTQREQPMAIAFEALRQSMYGEHPYALPSLGTDESVANLSQELLRAYHQRHFRPDNLVISIAGRIDLDGAIAQIEAVFGDWTVPTEPLPQLTLPAVSTQPGRVQQAQPTHQAILMLGYQGPTVGESGYAPMKVINAYLGNGMSSRLFVELREKQGLAYEVSTFYPTRLEVAPFGAYMGTSPDNAARALQGLHHEVKRLIEAPLSVEEVEATRNKMLGQYLLGKQTNAQIAQVYGWYETLGLGLDFDDAFQAQLQQVSARDIQETATQYLQKPFVSLVGPQDVLTELDGVELV